MEGKPRAVRSGTNQPVGGPRQPARTAPGPARAAPGPAAELTTGVPKLAGDAVGRFSAGGAAWPDPCGGGDKTSMVAEEAAIALRRMRTAASSLLAAACQARAC